MNYNFGPILHRIKKAKAACNLTNEELSIRSGVPLSTINKIMCGNTQEPKLPAFMAIAHALNVSVDFLVYGEHSNGINAEEDELLKKYRSLDARGKETVNQSIEEQAKYIQKESAAFAEDVANTMKAFSSSGKQQAPSVKK